MYHNQDVSLWRSSLPTTYFLPDDGNVSIDVRCMALLIPKLRHETGRHEGRRGTWVFLPGSETLDSLEMYKVARLNESKDRPLRPSEDQPSRRKPHNKPTSPRTKQREESSRLDESAGSMGDIRLSLDTNKKSVSPRNDTLEVSGRRLDRDRRALRQKERDLEKNRADLIKSCRAHEEKARDLRRSAEASRKRDDSRERNKRPRPNQGGSTSRKPATTKVSREDKDR